MASEVAICNAALSEVGGNRIISLDDNTVEGRLCSDLYAPARDFVLEAREWAFATRRVELARLAEAPAFGYDAQFKIPSDCIRVLGCYNLNSASKGVMTDGQSPLDWEREGNNVLAVGVETMLLKYTFRVEDPNRFSSGFSQALSAYLAHLLAIPVQRSRPLQEQKFALYERRLAAAAATDGMQGRTRRVRSSILTNARRR